MRTIYTFQFVQIVVPALVALAVVAFTLLFSVHRNRENKRREQRQFRELLVSNFAERANDIVRAVHLLRQHGMAVGFPMQTADGKIIFPVDKNFTLTADQMLGLLERGELHAEGVRRSVEAQAATPMRKKAAAS